MADDEEIKPKEEKDDSRLFIGIGCAVTFLWIGAVLILYSETKLPEDWSLNHLGDFLAGAFAPLALFWFVLGFFLQIKEIRYQRIEITGLKNEAKLQTRAELEKISLTKKHERPHLEYQGCLRGNARTPILIIRFKNAGGLARNITIYDFGNNKEIIPTHVSIEKGGVSQLNLEPGSYDNLPTLVSLTYQDKHDIPYTHHELLGEDPIQNNHFFKSMKQTVPIEEV